jgi:hypothetical protein
VFPHSSCRLARSHDLSFGWYCGPITCPNCQSPIADDVNVCPYCHSTAPMRAPWKRGRWQSVLVVGVALLAIWLGDQLFGTNLVASLKQFLQKAP